MNVLFWTSNLNFDIHHTAHAVREAGPLVVDPVIVGDQHPDNVAKVGQVGVDDVCKAPLVKADAGLLLTLDDERTVDREFTRGLQSLGRKEAGQHRALVVRHAAPVQIAVLPHHLPRVGLPAGRAVGLDHIVVAIDHDGLRLGRAVARLQRPKHHRQHWHMLFALFALVKTQAHIVAPKLFEDARKHLGRKPALLMELRLG
mmetsp:Transcript_4331/g.12507  ORF Transcript_4331/g.12507 Transcript_4331/m.12507 type:complete len:201 (+) Transcript_4331:308-910(+)